MRRLTAWRDGRRYDLAISPVSGSSRLFQIKVRPESGEQTIHQVEILSRTAGRWTVVVDNRVEDLVVSNGSGVLLVVTRDNRTYRVEVSAGRRAADGLILDESATSIRADMAGKVVAIFKKPGDSVERGESLAILEAMKMQNPVKSPRSCLVKACQVREGEVVSAGQSLFEISGT